jgi:hypothetical protein
MMMWSGGFHVDISGVNAQYILSLENPKMRNCWWLLRSWWWILSKDHLLVSIAAGISIAKLSINLQLGRGILLKSLPEGLWHSSGTLVLVEHYVIYWEKQVCDLLWRAQWVKAYPKSTKNRSGHKSLSQLHSNKILTF